MTEPTRVQVFSPAFLVERVDDVEVGDKIIMHASFLKTCERFLVPGPLIIRLQNHVSGKSTHCGVLDFTAQQPRTVYVPRWIMENLGVSDCGHLLLNVAKTIPRAKFLRFRPAEAGFHDSVMDLKAQLEYSLRRMTVLTIGDVIPVSLYGRRVPLEVMDVKPECKAQAVCVIDTECEVDVEDTEPAAPSVVVISPGVPTTGVVSPQSILRYDFPIPTSSFSSLHFTLTVQPSPSSVCGDVDLYITSSDLPASRHQWEWRNVDISPIKYIQIGSGDVSLVGRPMLHIAVVPYFAEGAAVTVGCGTISLVVQVETAAPLPSATPEPSLGVASGGTEPCPNCGVLVSNPSLDRHVAFCTRNNYRCSTCMKVMRISERGTHAHCPRCSAVVHPDGLEKHIALDHTAFVCECGCSVDPSLLSMHKSFECDLRPVPCTYCGAMFPERKLHSHEEYCGGRTQPCVECGAVMLVKLLADHVSRGCAPVSSEGKAAPPPGYLSWLREVNAGDSATCATIADDSAEMDTSSPVPVTHARVSADECEYQYSDDDDETGYEYQPPARTVYAAPSSRPVSTSDLPPYLAPGNGAVTITDSESDVMLIATVSRLDLVGEDSWVCPSCSEGFATKPLLQLHQGSLCPKRK